MLNTKKKICLKSAFLIVLKKYYITTKYVFNKYISQY